MKVFKCNIGRYIHYVNERKILDKTEKTIFS